MGVRFILLTTLFGLIFGILGFNLYRVQISKGAYYLDKVQARMANVAELELQRGEIFITDRYGNAIPVAINRGYPVIYAVPKEIKDPRGEADALAPIMGASSTAVYKMLDNPQSLFRVLIEKATGDQVNAVNALDLQGIYSDTKQYRYYPFGSLAANVIGFVGVNGQNPQPTGLYGVEKEFNNVLAAGTDVHLTIDRVLQAQAEELIKNLVGVQTAESGSVIIENPVTGAILTMASYPTFDPNAYASSSIGLYGNQSIQDNYEPGSVFKPVTMSIGIDNAIFTPTSTYNDKGVAVLNGSVIRNWNLKAYGPNTTMTKVIEESLNTGAVWAEQQIGNKLFYAGVKKFGFGDPTGIDLPNEASGSLANLEKKDAKAVDYGTAAFGQGVSVTPIQMINSFAVIANGGLLMRPYLDASDTPEVMRRVISTTTAEEVRGMMIDAVNKAVVATIPQFTVAGKTGTAQIPDLQTGGYYPNQYIHTFIGMVPATRPQYLILIKLVRPKSELAAVSVVPAFQQLASFVLNYENVTPDNPGNSLDAYFFANP